jgi:predicted flavoprotein YhiN
MAALFAARSGADTVLIERTKDGGRKILISGGGRCNVLPGTFRPREYVTDSSPNTLGKILRSWPLREQKAFFEDDLGIPLKHEPESDKLFPVSDRARDVRDALVKACLEAGVEIRFEALVAGIEPRAGGPGWVVRTEPAARGGKEAGAAREETSSPEGRRLEAAALILATGGLSVPATGSDGRGLAWARGLGLKVHETYAALTPLLADPPVHAHLAGVSLDVEMRGGEGKGAREASGGFLFTHRGYSGPSVLNVSHRAVRTAPGRSGGAVPGGAGTEPGRGAPESGRGTPDPVRVEVAWTGESDAVWDDRLQTGPGTVGSVLGRHLPARLVETLVEEAGVPADRPLAQLRRDERQRLVAHLAHYPLPWTGDEGYRKAEVTGGGVALDQVDPRTLECRGLPRLYLCGEILDAFGPIGGHNFLWAWATGRSAGRAAAESLGGGVED